MGLTKPLIYGLLLGLLAMLITGCGSISTSNKDLSAQEAAKIIYQDLAYHQVSVEKVNVTKLSFQDSNTAKADVTYTTKEGKNMTQLVNLIKKDGRWVIIEHEH